MTDPNSKPELVGRTIIKPGDKVWRQGKGYTVSANYRADSPFIECTDPVGNGFSLVRGEIDEWEAVPAPSATSKDDLTLALRCIASEYFLDDEGPGQRIMEAAGEINRLTAALAACQTYDYRQIIEESDRLRAALERIAEIEDQSSEGYLGEVHLIAMAALSTKTQCSACGATARSQTYEKATLSCFRADCPNFRGASPAETIPQQEQK